MLFKNIFSGEEIRKQQPTEAVYFEDVDSKWKSLVHELQRIKNVYRACHTQGSLDIDNEIKIIVLTEHLNVFNYI